MNYKLRLFKIRLSITGADAFIHSSFNDLPYLVGLNYGITDYEIIETSVDRKPFINKRKYPIR